MKLIKKHKELSLIANNNSLRKLAVYYISSGFVMWYAIEVLFLKNNLNLSTVQILSFPLIVKVISLIFEFPSSVVADRWSRSKTLALSLSFGILAGVSGFLSQGYYTYLLLILFYSLASALHTGTDSSLVYDILKSENKESTYLKVRNIFGRLFMLAIALGSILGGPLSTLTGFRNIYLISVILMPFGVISVLSLKEPDFHRKNQELKAINHVKKSFRMIFSNNILLVTVLFISIAEGVIFTNLLEYQPLSFIKLGTPDYLIGILKTLSTNLTFVMLGGLVALLSSRRKFWLLLMNIILIAACIASYYSHSYILLAVYLSIGFLSIRYMSELVNESLQHSIPSSERASIVSIIGIVSAIIFAITWPLLTVFSRTFGDSGYLLASSLIAAMLLIINIYLNTKQKMGSK